jgi:hypothetical protein
LKRLASLRGSKGSDTSADRYLLAAEMSSSRKRIGFALSESFRRSLLETRTLTNTENSEVVLLRELLAT